MRHIIAASLLAAGLALTGTSPAAAQSMVWSGTSLQISIPSTSNCRIMLERAFLVGSGPGASIHLVFRNRGAVPTRLISEVRLQGNGQSKSGSFGPITIVPGAATEQATIAPYGGSLAGSTLVVSLSACAAG